MITGRWQAGLALSLLTTMLWGSLPVALKSLLATMSPLTISWYRYVISTLILTAFLFARGQMPAAHRLWALKALLTGAVLSFAGNNVLFAAGLKYLGPSAAEVVIQLAPLLLIVAGVLFFHERFGLWQWIGVAGLLGGMALFFHRNLAASLVSPGVVLILVSSVLWTAYAMAQKQLLASLSSLAIVWAAYGCGALLLLPAAQPSQVSTLDGAGWVFLIYCGLNSVVAYGSFAEAMSHWEVSRVSAVLATTPLFTPVFAELAARLWPHRFAHEGLDWLQIAGGVLVAGGSILAALARNDK